MKENTLELSFEMYEELKETLIKTLRSELAEADHNRLQPLIRTQSSNCRFRFCNWSRPKQG